MTLNTYSAPVQIDFDKFRIDQNTGKPLLVVVREYRADYSSAAYPDPHPVVVVDGVDVGTGTIFIGVMWGAKNVVAGLSQYAGTDQVLPVKSTSVRGGAHGSWVRLDPLEDSELATATAWYTAYPNAITEARLAREQAAATAAVATNTPPPPAALASPAVLAIDVKTPTPLAPPAQPVLPGGVTPEALAAAIAALQPQQG